MRVIAIHGVRGGSGRTPMARTLASALAAQQHRVLVLDATRPGHIPDWGRWFAAQGRDRLSRRIRLARTQHPDEVARTLELARAAGVELGVIDTAGMPAQVGNALGHAALRAAHLIVLPFRAPSQVREVLDEIEALDALPAVALAAEARGAGGRAAFREAWRAWGGPPEGLLRSVLGHRAALAAPPLWLHARHAELLAQEGGRRPDLFGVGADVTEVFARQPHDPVGLAEHAGAVHEANAVAAELLFRLEGLHLAPEAPPEPDWPPPPPDHPPGPEAPPGPRA